jgi:hypothetical protein
MLIYQINTEKKKKQKMSKEYSTLEDVKQYHENILVITEKIGLIPLGLEFEYNGKSNSDVRKIIRNKLLTAYPDLNSMGAGIHIAWGKSRYNELFNMNHRLKHPRYTKCAFTVGNPFREGPQTKIPFIAWKRQFRDVSICDDETVTYVYQTTKNTWRIFKYL